MNRNEEKKINKIIPKTDVYVTSQNRLIGYFYYFYYYNYLRIRCIGARFYKTKSNTIKRIV
jgi:hypothetical protein